MNQDRVPFGALTLREDAAAVREAIERVVASGWFILGPEVEAFEAEFAAASGARHAVGIGNGTDALALVLKALDIGPGDEVVTSPLSAAYSALAIIMAGATPVFADVDPVRLTLDPDAAERAITPRTKALLPVHLYGQPAAMASLARLAERHRLALVEDCCQAHLATCGGKPVGTFGAAGAFSFYPTKNLGALGDGGAVITNDDALAERIKRLRNGGQTDRYSHQEAGVNSRLDELQAAILRARLPFLKNWTARRRALGAVYRAALRPEAGAVPELDAGHVYHLFVVRSTRRSELQKRLAARHIETLVHYPTAIPRQPAFAASHRESCPHTITACAEVLSLPLHPGMDDATAGRVADAINEFQQD